MINYASRRRVLRLWHLSLRCGFFLEPRLCRIHNGIADTCKDSNITTRLIKCFDRFNSLRFLKAYEQVRCNSPYRVMLCIF